MCAPSRVLFDRSAGLSDVRVSDYRRNRTVRWTWPSKVVTAEGECCKTTATVPLPKLYQAHRRPSPGSLISRSPGIRWSDRSPPHPWWGVEK